ncbi:helix-turn-helix domain-containing protein [Morganella morganii]
MKKKSEELNEKIGNYIKKIRKEKGLSGSELAKKLNFSQQQLSRYENGKTKLTIETINEILLALNKQWFNLFNEVIYEFDYEQMIHIINKEKNYQLLLSEIIKCK